MRTDLCIRNASKMSRAFRMFPFASCMIDNALSSGKVSLSFFATCFSTFSIYNDHDDPSNSWSIGCVRNAVGSRIEPTSSSSGAATLTSKQRLRMGEMILLVELAHMMSLMFVEYFSMVRRRAAWASRLRASASLMMTTVRIERGEGMASVRLNQGDRGKEAEGRRTDL